MLIKSEILDMSSNLLSVPGSRKRCNSDSSILLIESPVNEDSIKPSDSPNIGRRMSAALLDCQSKWTESRTVSSTQNESLLAVPQNYRRHSSAAIQGESSSEKKNNLKLCQLPDMCRRLSAAVFERKSEEMEDTTSKDEPHFPPLFAPKSIDFSFKVLLLGDSGVGKTCLLMRLKRGIFLRRPPSTLGIDYKDKEMFVDESRVKLRVWDTAGTEKFRSVTRTYYRDADALLLLYDVSNEDSFRNTRMWLDDVKENAPDDVVIMLIGNKCDVPEAQRRVGRKKGVQLAKEFGGVKFMETSAKDGQNVELVLLTVARILIASEVNPPTESRSLHTPLESSSRCKWTNCE